MTLSEWLFSDNSKPEWIALAKDELIGCKPVAGLGIWNASREDCENYIVQTIAGKIIGTMDAYGLPTPDLNDPAVHGELRAELYAVATALVKEAISEIPWWTDSDALFAETGLRHSDKDPEYPEIVNYLP